MIYISGKITDSDPEVQKKNLARFFEVEDRLENEMQGLNFGNYPLTPCNQFASIELLRDSINNHEIQHIRFSKRVSK